MITSVVPMLSSAAWGTIGTLGAAITVALGGYAVARLNRSPPAPSAAAAPVMAEPTPPVSPPTFTDVAKLLTTDYQQREERDRLEHATFRTWALRGIETLQRFIRSLGHEPPDIGPQP